jgi:hypothetical protein
MTQALQTHANKCSKPEHQDMLSVSGKGSESTRDSDSGDELGEGMSRCQKWKDFSLISFSRTNGY